MLQEMVSNSTNWDNFTRPSGWAPKVQWRLPESMGGQCHEPTRALQTAGVANFSFANSMTIEIQMADV